MTATLSYVIQWKDTITIAADKDWENVFPVLSCQMRLVVDYQSILTRPSECRNPVNCDIMEDTHVATTIIFQTQPTVRLPLPENNKKHKTSRCHEQALLAVLSIP
jgi:hypothetical protein